MRFSVENRVPFLTLEMAEFLLSLPEDYLISDLGETKRIFRAAMRGIVPDAILDRRDKIGFVTPMEHWLVSGGASGLGKVLTTHSLSFLRMAELRSDFEALTRGRGKFTSEMWRAINYIHWAQMFHTEFG